MYLLDILLSSLVFVADMKLLTLILQSSPLPASRCIMHSDISKMPKWIHFYYLRNNYFVNRCNDSQDTVMNNFMKTYIVLIPFLEITFISNVFSVCVDRQLSVPLMNFWGAWFLGSWILCGILSQSLPSVPESPRERFICVMLLHRKGLGLCSCNISWNY